MLSWTTFVFDLDEFIVFFFVGHTDLVVTSRTVLTISRLHHVSEPVLLEPEAGSEAPLLGDMIVLVEPLLLLHMLIKLSKFTDAHRK